MKNTIVAILTSLFLYGCINKVRLDIESINRGIRYCADKHGLREIKESFNNNTMYICINDDLIIEVIQDENTGNE